MGRRGRLLSLGRPSQVGWGQGFFACDNDTWTRERRKRKEILTLWEKPDKRAALAPSHNLRRRNLSNKEYENEGSSPARCDCNILLAIGGRSHSNAYMTWPEGNIISEKRSMEKILFPRRDMGRENSLVEKENKGVGLPKMRKKS